MWQVLDMIGPLFLRGELVAKFREHLLQMPYSHVISEGRGLLSNESRIFSESDAEALVHRFEQSSFPLVCFAGSKSSIPFWDYHIALRYGERKDELKVYELLAREPAKDNAMKAVLMAYDLLVNEIYGVDKLHVPCQLAEAVDRDIGIEATGDNTTILYRKK